MSKAFLKQNGGRRSGSKGRMKELQFMGLSNCSGERNINTEVYEY